MDLTRLADLALSGYCQKPPWAPPPLNHLWTSRYPILLPPSPIPGEEHNPVPDPGDTSRGVFCRSRLGFCTSKNGDVYFYGGDAKVQTRVIYHYSIRDNTVTPLTCWGTSPARLSRHTMALVGNVIAVHGGLSNGDPSLFLLNLASRKWSRITTLGDSPGVLKRHTMATVDSTIYIFGGCRLNKPSNELWTFNLDSLRTVPKWELVKPSSRERPHQRSKHTFVRYQNQLILMGGWNGEDYLGDVWSFDMNSRRWRELQCTGSIPDPRRGHAAVVLDDIIYVIGGRTKNGLSNDVFALKVAEKRWFKFENSNATPIPRYNHAAFCVGIKIFIFGGVFDKGADERGLIHILNADYINNSAIHAPERLSQLQLEHPNMQTHETLAHWAKKYFAKANKTLAENSSLESRVKELEHEVERLKCNQLISPILESLSRIDSLTRLWGADAQLMVDFLAEVLKTQSLLQSHASRRHILHLLSKLAKSAQVFPRCTELSGVHCNLATPANDEGGYGFIYKGVFRKQVVCVKAVRIYESGTKASRLLRAQAGELALLALVSHVNVIPLYGAYLSSEDRPRICIVTPWMENGNLVDYLAKSPEISRIRLMGDVAAGLEFLHNIDIIHADLKAQNILVSQSQRAMLADFGVSTILKTSVSTTTANDFGGTAYWMAPELHLEQSPTLWSDMWGFGCVCFEVLTGKTPFADHYNLPQLIRAFMRGQVTPLRPKNNGEVTIVNGGPLVTLAEKCWDYDPTLRPTATEALRFLTELDGEDSRPSMDEELAMFEVAKSGRTEVKIDYRHVLSIVQKVGFGFTMLASW